MNIIKHEKEDELSIITLRMVSFFFANHMQIFPAIDFPYNEEVNSWDIDAAIEKVEDIEGKTGKRVMGFYFSLAGLKADGSAAIYTSHEYYLNAKIIESEEARTHLKEYMINHGWKKAVRRRDGSYIQGCGNEVALEAKIYQF